MRRTLFLLLALSFVLAAGCSDDDAPAPVPGIVTFDDFPLIDGLTYTYLIGSGDGPLLDTLQVVLSDDRNPPGEKPGRSFFGYRVIVTPYGSSEPSEEYRGQISNQGPDTLSVNPNVGFFAQSEYVFPFEVGTEWGHGETRVTAMEGINLPIGHFDNAYRICFEKWEGTESDCTKAHWFVPGVGIVKVVYDYPEGIDALWEDNLRVWELLSVSPQLHP